MTEEETTDRRKGRREGARTGKGRWRAGRGVWGDKGGQGRQRRGIEQPKVLLGDRNILGRADSKSIPKRRNPFHETSQLVPMIVMESLEPNRSTQSSEKMAALYS